MRYRYPHILLLLLAVWMTGCQFRQDEYVDFSDIQGAGGLKFQVIGQNERDLSEGLPSNCYLPDGTPVNEWSNLTPSLSQGEGADTDCSNTGTRTK